MIDDVRLEPAGLLDGLGDGAGLGDDLEPVAPVEQRDEALAHHLVVVDDEQAQGTGAWSVTGEFFGAARRAVLGCRGGAGRGDADDDTRARPAGRPRPNVPPMATARSRMLPMPWCRPSRVRPGERGGVEAPPVVLDASTSSSPSASSRTSPVRVAPAWRATLDSASRAMNRMSDRRSGGIDRSSVCAAVEVDLEVDDRVHPELLGEPRERLDRVLLAAHRRPQPEDVRADVGDHEVERVDRAVHARDGLLAAALVLDQLRHDLQRQADARRSTG